MNHKTTILLIEDEKSICRFITTSLENGGYRVASASTGSEGLSLAASLCPDEILLDLGLPDMDGIDILKQIRKWFTKPIIVISARTKEQEKVAALDLGADDYITKPFNPLELAARVKSNLRRYTSLGSMNVDNKSLYQVGGLVINDDTKQVTVDDEPVKLTPIEYNILLLLVKNQGRVFSIDQIYENIWNEDAIGADNTVAVHIRHIREKIEINPKEPKYLKVVWGVGYKVDKQ